MIFRTSANVIPLPKVYSNEDPFGEYSHLAKVYAGVAREIDPGHCVAVEPEIHASYYKIRRDGKGLVPITKEDFERLAMSCFLASGTFLPTTHLTLNPQ